MAYLQPYQPLRGNVGPKSADAIVVLSAEARDGREYGGDTVGPLSLARLRYAAHLHRLTGIPILATGGPFRPSTSPLGSLVAEVLQHEFGVPVRWIETRASDTRENARFSAALLRDSGVTGILLVSSAWHLRRAVPLFTRCGLTVTPAPTNFQPRPGASLAALLPSQEAALASYYAAYEMLGILRDWLLERLRGPAPC